MKAMIYTPLTKKALKLCYEAHRGQTDKSGLPYVFHPFHLAEQMTDEESAVAALLHDVVEDTEYSFADLENMGFGGRVLEALRLLTHEKGVPYPEYVKRLKSNPIARSVKIADLRHNSDLSRLEAPSEEDLRRREKYQDALKLLEEQPSS